MRFHCDGADYETDEMTSFAIGNKVMPFVYLSHSPRDVFVQTMDRVRGVLIRRASGDEIRHLATAYHVPELLRALPPVDGEGAVPHV